jgi:hypothetical protein
MREDGKTLGQSAADDADERRITILYIGGCGRSGSTLMMRLLAEHTGGAAVGELFHLWRNGYQRDFICGCGVRFSECGFWGAVTRRVFGDVPVDPERMIELQRRVHGPQALLALRFPILRSPSYRGALAEYTEVLDRLYAAIAYVADSNVVIDSSKSPQLARMLELLPNADVHLVHLVRDSRATAWSWGRVRAEPALGDTALMRRFPAWRSALEWTANHAILLFDRRRPPSYTVSRYEDFVQDPGGAIHRAVPWLGSDSLDRTTGGYVLSTSHSVTGNPNRFESGRVSITLDSEWESAMPSRDRWVVTSISAPLLKWFGYPLRVRARAAARRAR